MGFVSSHKAPEFNRASFSQKLAGVVAGLFCDLASAVVEEWLKRKANWAFAVLSAVETIGIFICSVPFWYNKDFKVLEDLGQQAAYAIVRTFLHFVLTLLPFPAAVGVHVLFNTAVRHFPRLKKYVMRLYNEFRLAEIQEINANRVETVSQGDVYLESDSLTYVCGGQEMPMTEETQRLLTETLYSPKFTLVRCLSTQSLISPDMTLQSAILMMAQRFDVTVLKVDKEVLRLNSLPFRCLLSSRYKQHGTFRAMSDEEFIEYVDAQEAYDAAKKQKYKEWVKEYPNRHLMKPERVVMAKTDEILKLKKLDGDSYAKVRPIFPCSRDDIGHMQFILNWKYVLHDRFEWEVGGVQHSIYYHLLGEPRDLDSAFTWAATHPGVHSMHLGDDFLFIKSDDEEIGCAAGDAVKCDATCGEELHKVFCEIWLEGGCSPDVLDDYMEGLSGTFEFKLKLPPGFSRKFFRFLHKKKRKTTLTGAPATSVVAFMALAIVRVAASFRHARQPTGWPGLEEFDATCATEMPSPPGVCSFLSTFESVANQNGHEVEWELDMKWGPPQAVSFLGGYFFPKAGRWVHVSLNFVKNLVFPDPDRIKGSPFNDEQSPLCALIAARLPEPIFNQTPVGRALRKSLTNFLARNNYSADDPYYADVYRQHLSWYQQTILSTTSYEAIFDYDFWEGVRINCEWRNIPCGVERLQSWLGELSLVDNYPAPVEDHGVLYDLRFGPKEEEEWFGLNLFRIGLRAAAVVSQAGGTKIAFDSFLVYMGAKNKNSLINEAGAKEINRAGKRGGTDVAARARSAARAAGRVGRAEGGNRRPDHGDSRRKRCIGECAVGSLAHQREREYFDSLDHPETVRDVKIPGTPAGRTAADSVCCRTQATGTLTAAAGGCTQVTLFSHPPADLGGGAVGGPNMDAEANHGARLIVGSPANYASAGSPYGSNLSGNNGEAAVGVVSTGLVSGAFRETVNNATDNIMLWDMPFPVQQLVHNSGHQRARMVSCVITIENTTDAADIGGDITTVQPPLSGELVGSTQNFFGRYATVTVHKPTGCRVAIIPRAESLAYWHYVAGGTTSVKEAALWVFLNAGPSAQTYRYVVDANWEICGATVQNMVTPAVNIPGAITRIQDEMEVLFNAGRAGAIKTDDVMHVIRTYSQTPAMRKLLKIPENNDDFFDHALKLLGKAGQAVLNFLL
jgi:hypothetical protein